MTLQNDDLLLVNRGGQSFKTEYGLIKQNINDGIGVIVGENAPADPNEGDLWYNSEDGRLYVWYVNETTGIVTALTVRNGGSGYNNSGIDVSTDGGSGSGLSIDYQAGVGGALVNPTVNQGGHAYQVSDVVFVTGSGNANASVTVTAVNTVSIGQWVDASPDGGDVGGGPDLWQRTGTTLSPVTAGDDVDLGTGDLSAAAGTFSGTLKTTGAFRVGEWSNDRTTSINLGTIQTRRDNDDNAFIVYSGGDAIANQTYIVNSKGTVKIGGTLPASPNITLSANGSATFTSPQGTETLHLYENGAASNVSVQEWRRGSLNGGYVRVAWLNNQGTFSCNGGAANIGNSGASERRFKENIKLIDAGLAWETVKSTPYYGYNFIGTPQESIQYGPIVDELPEDLVRQAKNTEEVAYTYDAPLLNARMFVALQTALTRIEALEATNASLEARLTALEGGN